MIESLRAKLQAERRRNLVQEMEIRKEMGDAMIQQLMESEELRSYVNFICFASLSFCDFSLSETLICVLQNAHAFL